MPRSKIRSHHIEKEKKFLVWLKDTGVPEVKFILLPKIMLKKVFSMHTETEKLKKELSDSFGLSGSTLLQD